MNFSSDEKRVLLKIATNIVQENRGHGPKIIYINYFQDHIVLHIKGFVSEVEKTFMNNFSFEVIDHLEAWYRKSSLIAVNRFNELLNFHYHFELLEYEINLEKEYQVFKLKIIDA